MRIDQPHAASAAACCTRRRSAAPLQPVGAARRSASQRGRQSASSIRWSSCASMRPNWPIGCKSSRRRSIAARASLAAQEADLEAKWESARQWLAERQQELDERAEAVAAPRAGIARARSGRRSAREGTDASSRGSARRARASDCRIAKRSSSECEAEIASAAGSAWTTTGPRGTSGTSGCRPAKRAIETRHRELDQRQAQLYRDIEQLIADKARAEDRLAEVERREAKIADWESRLQAQGGELEQQTEALRAAGRRVGNRAGRTAQGIGRPRRSAKRSSMRPSGSLAIASRKSRRRWRASSGWA